LLARPDQVRLMGDEPMRTALEQLALLQRQLQGTPAAAAGADIRLVAGDQVLVSRNMVRNPALDRGGKTSTYVPGRDGYQVYVACRPAEAHDALAAVSQRMTGPSGGPVAWDGRTMRLRLGPADTSRDWLLGNSRGEVVTVHAAVGSPSVLGEVNAILSDVEAVLLT
jgi:hypothetical protein